MCQLFVNSEPVVVPSSHPRLETETEAGRGRKKKQRRLKRAWCTCARTISSAGMRALSAATEVNKLCSLAWVWENRHNAAMWSLCTILTLPQYQKCMYLNTDLLSGVCHRVKQMNTTQEPIMCRHAWPVHPLPKMFKLQRSTMRMVFLSLQRLKLLYADSHQKRVSALIVPAAGVWVHACCWGRMDEFQAYLLTPPIFQVSWLSLKMWGGEQALICPICCLGTAHPPQKHHHSVCVCLGLVQLC